MRRPTTSSSRVAETDSQRSGPRLVPSLCLGLRGPEVETHQVDVEQGGLIA